MFHIYWCTYKRHEHQALDDEVWYSRLKWKWACMAIKSMRTSSFLDNMAERSEFCCMIYKIDKWGFVQT